MSVIGYNQWFAVATGKSRAGQAAKRLFPILASTRPTGRSVEWTRSTTTSPGGEHASVTRVLCTQCAGICMHTYNHSNTVRRGACLDVAINFTVTWVPIKFYSDTSEM